jgi:SpoVK/Ycf46/Vps4 family AAA+-type ATPase
MKDYIKDTILSLKRGFPFIAIETSDYQQTLADLKAGLGEETNGGQRALLHHDMARGALGINELGLAVSATINSGAEPAVTTAKIEECLQRALDLMPPRSILVIDDIHLLLEHKDDTIRALYVQCIRNCRDAFKSSKRTLVFLAPKFRPPVELGKDMDIIVAPTPTHEDRIALAKNVCKGAQLPEAAPEKLEEVASITRGLTAFASENLMAMAITKEGFNLNILRRGSVAAINAVTGLKVIEANLTLDDIVGVEQGKKHARMKAGGELCPMAVVRVDEISDQMAGRNDSNGLNRDAQGCFLQSMENYKWRGCIYNGFGGTGKTALSIAFANVCKATFIDFDLGAMKGGIVGTSEKNIRTALETIWDRFGERVFFIGTTNSADELTPQMMRRFGVTLFFDLLKDEEQKPLWVYYKKKFGLPDNAKLPPCAGWTGAEIERCCEAAWEFKLELTDAAQFISPVVLAMGAEGVDKMRAQAEGKYLSASEPGQYTTKRGLDLKKMRDMLDQPRDISLN